MLKTTMSSLVAMFLALLPTIHADDAAADFSHTNNPSGNWTYGYNNGSFIKTTNVVQVHTNVWFWEGLPGSGYGEPTVGKNEGTNAWVIGGTTTYAPGAFALHPGMSGQRSVLRWTAPTSGNFQIDASFIGGDPSTTSDASIVKGASTLYSTNVIGNTNLHSYSALITVTNGQIIDFSVGYGTNNNYNFDTTITTVAIARVFDAPADFSHTTNSNGVWTYGYDNGSFQKITNIVQVYTNVWFWEGIPGTGYGEPTVGKNEGTTNWVIGGTTTYAPGDMALHPGQTGQRAVLRFTSPRATAYQIDAIFIGGDPSTTSDASIVTGGTNLFSANITGNTTPHPFTSQISVASGQIIDFSVGYGPNHTYSFDTTITDVVIKEVP